LIELLFERIFRQPAQKKRGQQNLGLRVAAIFPPKFTSALVLWKALCNFALTRGNRFNHTQAESMIADFDFEVLIADKDMIR